MDKDEFFKIQDEECCYNMLHYFTEFDWVVQSSIAHNSNSEEFEKIKKSEFFDKNNELLNEMSEKKENAQFKLIKPYEAFLSETEFFKSFKKISNLKNQEKSHEKVSSQFLQNEKFFEKRIAYFEKIVNSHEEYKHKFNKLTYHSNYLLEKYSILNEYSLDKLPGLKPNSNWPENLSDLTSRLSALNIFQMFLQPFDVNENFYNEALDFIRRYYRKFITCVLSDYEKADVKTAEFFDVKNCDTEAVLYEEYLIKAISTVFTVKLMKGDVTKIFEFLTTIKEIFDNEELNNKNKILKKINQNLIKKTIYETNNNNNSNNEKEDSNTNLPRNYIKKILNFYKENELLPLMRNYAIIDTFSIPKNILFTPAKHIFSNCASITTDSSYLYIIRSGVNSGLLKIGTGFNNTIKGKIYLDKKFSELKISKNSNLIPTNNTNPTNVKPDTRKNSFCQNENSNNQNSNSQNNFNSNSPNFLFSPFAENLNNNNNPQNQNQNQNNFDNFSDPKNFNFLDFSFQWIFLKNKLYLKQNFNTNNLTNSQINSKDFGFLIVINPIDFQIEEKIKLIFPKKCYHPAVRKKNENFQLLTNGEKLSILILEPIFKNEKKIPDEKNFEEKNFNEKTKENLKDNLKKSRYSYYQNPNFCEQTQNFEEDLFSYMNLILLDYSVDTESNFNFTNFTKKNFEENENVKNSKLTKEENSKICELQESLLHFSFEECKKALMLNKWKMEKSAEFLVDGNSDLKQPLLINENSALIFQTKIESIVKVNNKLEFKIVDNKIFDVTNFDLIKWNLTENKLFGYKLKEGACVIFSADNKKLKKFDYEYSDLIKEKNAKNLLGSFNEVSNNSSKNAKQKLNVNWLENNVNEKSGILETFASKKIAYKDINNLDKKILDSIKKENNEIFSSVIDYENPDDCMNNVFEDSFLYEEFENIIPNEIPSTSNSMRNKLEAKNSKNNFTNILNNNNNNSNNSLQNKFGKILTTTQKTKENNETLINSNSESYKKLYTNFLNMSTNTNNNINNINNLDNKNPQKIQKALLTSNNNKIKEPILPKIPKKLEKFDKKKKSKKRKSSELSEEQEEILSSLLNRQIKKTENKLTEKANLNLENLPEEKIQKDSISGTYLKIVSSIQLCGDSIFCFDFFSKNFYLLSNMSLSMNLFVCNSFLIDKEIEEKNYFNEEKKFSEILVEDIEKFLDFDNSGINSNDNKSDNDSDFIEDVYTIVKKLCLLIDFKKFEMPWKYSDWNFFYSNFSESLNEKIKESNYNDNYTNEYPHLLLPSIMEKLDKMNLKIFKKKLELSKESNEDKIHQKIFNQKTEKNKITNFFKSEDLKKSKFSNNLNFYFDDINRIGNWNNDSNLLIESSTEINFEKIFNLKNERNFYFNLHTNFSTLEILYKNLQKNFEGKKSFENFENLKLDLLLLLQFVKNGNFSDEKNSNFSFIENFLNFLEKIFTEKNENFIKNLIIKILLCGWDLFCFNFELQVKWFYKIFEFSKNLEIEENEEIRKKYTFTEDYLDLNIEKAILGFDCNNDFNNDNYNTGKYLFSPFEILLKIITPEKNNNLLFNFHRINLVKIFDLIPVNENEINTLYNFIELNNMQIEEEDSNNNTSTNKITKNDIKTFNYICKPFYNSENLLTKTFPFHIILLGKITENKSNKEKIVKEILQKDLLSKKIEEEFNEKEEFISNRKSADFFSKKKFEFSKENLFGLILQKFSKIKKNFEQENPLDNLEKISKNFWDFLHKNFFEEKNFANKNLLLDLIANSLFISLGYLNSKFENLENSENSENEKNEINKITKKFIEKNLEFLGNFIQQKNLENLVKIKNARNENSTNFPFLKILNFNVFSFLLNFDLFIPDNPTKENMNFLVNFVKKISNDFMGMEINNNNDSDNNKILLKDVYDLLNPCALNGKDFNMEKIYEFNLGNEITYINETFSVNKNSTNEISNNISSNINNINTIAVEIEFISEKEKPFNYDLVIVSEDHNYNNMKTVTNNNLNNFGTCFMLKLNNSFSKTLYLTGKEVKIISPFDTEFGKPKLQNLKMGYNIIKPKINSTSKNFTNSNLKIKCYPYKSADLAIVKVNNKIPPENFFDEFSVFYIIDLLRIFDFVGFKLIKNLIKTIDDKNKENKFDENENFNKKIFDEFLLKNGLKKNCQIFPENFEDFSAYKKLFKNLRNFNKKNKIVSAIDNEKGILFSYKFFENVEKNLKKKNIKKFDEEKNCKKFSIENLIKNYLENNSSIKNSKNVNFLESQFLKILEISKKINEKNSLENLGLIENEINNTLVNKLKIKIREKIQEPMSLKSIKFFGSFTKELKIFWNLIENFLLIILINHLNIQPELFELTEEDMEQLKLNEEYVSSEIKNEVLLFLGNKINLLMNYMATNVQRKKETFDLIKNFVEEIKQIKLKDYQKRKENLIEFLLPKEKEFNKNENNNENNNNINISFSGENQAKISETKKQIKKTQKKETLTEKEKEKDNNINKNIVKGKPKNFKKKINTKRLYQDIKENPKKTKKSISAVNEKNPQNFQEEKNENSEEKKPENSLEEKIAKKIELEKLEISEIFKFHLEKKMKKVFELEAENEFLNLHNEINNKIREDLKENYSGNSQKLKSIMEINNLKFDENNLNESLNQYENLLKEKIKIFLNLLKLEKVENLFEFFDNTNEELNNFLNFESPFYQMAHEIFEKILFLNELNTEKDLKNLEVNSEEANLDLFRNNSSEITCGKLKNKSTSNLNFIDVNNGNNCANYFVNSLQSKILDSIYNLLYGNYNVEKIREKIEEQNYKMKLREIGINSLNEFINNDNGFDNSYKSLRGLFTSCFKNSIEENVETALLTNKINPEIIGDIIFNLINLYNSGIEKVLNNFNSNDDDTNHNTNSKKRILNSNYKSKEEIINPINQIKSESFSYINYTNEEINFEMDSLNNILSDLIILLKQKNKKNFGDLINKKTKKSTESEFIKFIENSLKLIYLNNYNKNNNKFLYINFKENLICVLAKIIQIKFNKKNFSGENQKFEKSQKIFILQDTLLKNLFSQLENLFEEKNKNCEIISLLEFILNLMNYLNLDFSNFDNSENLKFSLNQSFEILFKILNSSNTQKIINLICSIFTIFFKKLITENLSEKNSNSFLKEISEKFFSAIFLKLGNLITFENKIITLSQNPKIEKNEKNEKIEKNEKYFLLIQMNSPEIDYQFLVNALFYLEEKYPTILSLYKYKSEFAEFIKDKTKEKEFLEKLNLDKNAIFANINISNTGQKTKMYNYFNPLKTKVSKISQLEKIVDERLTNIRKAIEEGNKFFNVMKEKEEINIQKEKENSAEKDKNLKKEEAANSQTFSPLDSIRKRILLLNYQEAYQLRIKSHIKLAESIGETSSIRGYVCLEPSLTKEKAEEFAEILHKAYNHLLPHFKANIEEKVNLFPDELIYPKMHEKDLLLPGCTNILKETTVSYMNVTLCRSDVYEKIEKSQICIFENIRKVITNKSDDKRIKGGLYCNNIYGLSNQFLGSLNYNEISYTNSNSNTNSNTSIIDNEYIFGNSISMIIQELINLFYEIYEYANKEKAKTQNKQKQKSSFNIIEIKKTNSLTNLNLQSENSYEKPENFNFSQSFSSLINLSLKKIEYKKWRNLQNSEKKKIFGLLVSISDYYSIIRENTNTIFNKNLDNECKILSGGHKSGKNKSFVVFTKPEKISVEKIEIENLQKKKNNKNLIQEIPLLELFSAVIEAYEIYKENKEVLESKMLIQILMKILSEINLDNYHNYIYEIFLDKKKEENKILVKLLELLKNITNEITWIEKEDLFWEKEFIDSFERIYDKLDENSELIYSPIIKYNNLGNSVEYPIEQNKNENQDLITNFNFPDSNYKKTLPKINDMSKFQTALKNIVNFDRFIVGEIFNYCKSQYRDDEYLNSLYQIRYHLSNGDTISAKSDIHTIFDNNKVPQNILLPREHYDNREINREECFPGNYYLAKIPNGFLKDTKFEGLKNKANIGINEISVLLLLIDNSINQALVLYNDTNFSKAISFWINIDHLMFLDSQIKIPANSFELSGLVKEFNYLEKRLRILFSKKILLKFMKIFAVEKNFRNFDDTLLYLHLNDWDNFKLNPISGVFGKFKNFIKIKKGGKNTGNVNAIEENLNINLIEKNKSQIKNKNSNKSKFDISEILYNCSEIQISKDKFNNIIESTNKQNLNVENLLSELKINEKQVNDLIIQWSMNHWDELDNHFLKIKADLFTEYNKRYDEKLRSKEMFHIGNFNKKMLALHELCKFDISNFAGVILSFEKEAILGPQAKISFYSDPYGENLVNEIYSIKTTKNNLETVVFNSPKIWMHYTPGTRAFYIFEWFVQNRDSYLPCSIVYVPHIWPKLISLTDYSTASLLNDINLKAENFEILAKFIKKLLNHCTSMSLPAELQRRIFLITNRAILKASKFLSLLEQQKKINFNQLTISKKFNMLGIDEFSLVRLIDLITQFNEEQKNNNFSSAYIVEGVEIILSILAVIKEPFNILDKYLRETFNYILPLRIEAIIKLGQFLNFFQGTGNLDENLMKEISEQLKVNTIKENIFVVENFEENFPKEIIKKILRKILFDCKCKIVDFEKDVKFLFEENGNRKSIWILIDGFLIENLIEKVEEEKEPEPVEQLWECFYCSMENDNENTFCIFCDKNKKPKPKEKPKKKSNLIKTATFDNTIQDYRISLINELKKINSKVGEVLAKEKNENDKDKDANNNKDEKDIKISYEDNNIFDSYEELKNNKRDLLNTFLAKRLYSYVEDFDYVLQKYKLIEKELQNENNLADINEMNHILKIAEDIKEKKQEEKSKSEEKEKEKVNKNLIEIPEKETKENFNANLNLNFDYITLHESLIKKGIDLWLEKTIINKKSNKKTTDITIIEKLREFIDIKICKEKAFTLNFEAHCLRFVNSSFDSINSYPSDTFETYAKEFSKFSISEIRFYWAIIKYFNTCLYAALPIIKPPDTYLNERSSNEKDDEHFLLPFPKTMSAFLSSARGIVFSIIKQNLIKDIISYTEFSEEQVQIPTFKFERLNIQNNLDTQIKSNSSNLNLARKTFQNFSFNLTNFSNFYDANKKNESINSQNNSGNVLDEKNKSEINNRESEDLMTEESIFIQAFEQARDIDPAFFRSKKMPGDPHVGFKVEFKGELVVGIGGPYRQFFSDLSAELQDFDGKNKKILKLLSPTSNNLNKKGEFKDKFCIRPSYNSNSALQYYEFLGVMMGICIRTGVHLTLDLCSLTWKKILSQVLTIEDIIEFDEGLYEMINYLSNPELDISEYEANLNLTYSIEFTDGKIYELIPNGSDEKVEFEDRFKYLELCIKERLCEADSQISMIKKGIRKIIPDPLLKLLTYKELERLVCGSKFVDLDLLKANTKLSPELSGNANKVIWLWEILEEFSDDERIKFVKFCWAQERLPSTHEEFQKLQVVFMIKSYLDKTKKDLFPKADTCFFSIELPEYSSKEVMKKKILQAINLDNVSINADKVSNENANLNNDHHYNRYSDEDDY